MMWRRPVVFEIYAAGIKRLMDNFGVIPYVVGSEGDVSRERCEKHGFNYIEYPNVPLGAKANACLKAMRGHVDYVLNLGSDDLISNSLMQRYIKLIEEGYDMVGVKDMYFYERLRNRLIYWEGYTERRRRGESLGLGRVLSAKLLDTFNWEMWEENINMSMDWSMTQKLKDITNKKVISLKETNTFAVDIKDGNSMGNFETFVKKIKRKKAYFVNTSKIKESLPEHKLFKERIMTTAEVLMGIKTIENRAYSMQYYNQELRPTKDCQRIGIARENMKKELLRFYVKDRAIKFAVDSHSPDNKKDLEFYTGLHKIRYEEWINTH